MLVHRNYKAEACNKADEVTERIKRMKPSVVILDHAAYQLNKNKIRIPAIVLVEKNEPHSVDEDGETIVLSKPLHLDQLIHTVEKLVV